MANDFTEVIPKLLAQGLMALRENAITARIVNRDYDRQAAEQGQTIDVPIPSAITAQAVSPAATPPATADVTPTSVPITLNQWWEAPFYLTDKEEREVMRGTIPMQASEAIKSVINKLDQSLLAHYADFYGIQVLTGTNPMDNIKDATGMRKVLNQQLCPLDARHALLDPAAEAEALGLNQFADSTFSGSVQAILEGQLNRKLGAQWWMNQNVPSHTVGTTTAPNPVIDGAHVVGVKSLACTTGATTGAVDWKKGDIITIAGDTQTYVVTAAVAEASASTDFTCLIEPGLKVALSGTEVITLDNAGGVQNMMIHRDAIALATRPLLGVGANLGAFSLSGVDEESGLALRIEVTREHKRTRYSYDMLWGSAAVRREFGVRLLEQ
jgi:hypothetical protein